MLVFKDLTTELLGLSEIECIPKDENSLCRSIKVPTDTARTENGPLLPYQFSMTIGAGEKEFETIMTVAINCSQEVKVLPP